MRGEIGVVFELIAVNTTHQYIVYCHVVCLNWRWFEHHAASTQYQSDGRLYHQLGCVHIVHRVDTGNGWCTCCVCVQID